MKSFTFRIPVNTSSKVTLQAETEAEAFEKLSKISEEEIAQNIGDYSPSIDDAELINE